MTSSESEEQSAPRKRSRTSANGEEGSSKKARGRPRVDTQDATAADRRRTQIRLAQRAYRQRKETTISSLKEQNAQLQSIIEQMNKSFLHFNDAALKSGLLSLNSSLANELKHVTETFVTLAKAAACEGDHDGEEDNGEITINPISALHSAATSSPKEKSPAPQHTDVGWGYSATFLEEPPPRETTLVQKDAEGAINCFFQPVSTSSYGGNQLILSPNRPRMTVGQVFDQPRSQTDTSSDQQQLPFGLVDLLTRNQTPYQTDSHIYSVSIPTPDVTPPSTRLPSPPALPNLGTKTISPNWTYSHDETTFARRLTRSSLETGFHLLSMANLRPAALNYVFKLSLPYMNLDQLRDRFRMLLSRGTSEELDCWETPFIHLGGAGTHYPRKDAHGNTLPIPNSWNIRSIGPLSAKLIRAENTTDPSKSHDLNIDLTGFEGEWFDAYDVQGYLEQEKGCHIDPKDSFAEVLVDVDDDIPPPMGPSSLACSKKLDLNLDIAEQRRTSQPQSPGLSHGSSSTEASPNKTPDGNSIGAMFGSNETFGLDMAGADFNTDFPKFISEVDASAMFNEPLGLDLAPTFDHNINNSLTGFNTAVFGDMSTLGLDLMGGEIGMPVVKQKRKKTAWLDVSKMIDEIIKHGVCLGRAPGFRRKDVDMAFQASLIHAF